MAVPPLSWSGRGEWRVPRPRLPPAQEAGPAAALGCGVVAGAGTAGGSGARGGETPGPLSCRRGACGPRRAVDDGGAGGGVWASPGVRAKETGKGTGSGVLAGGGAAFPVRWRVERGLGGSQSGKRVTDLGGPPPRPGGDGKGKRLGPGAGLQRGGGLRLVPVPASVLVTVGS